MRKIQYLLAKLLFGISAEQLLDIMAKNESEKNTDYVPEEPRDPSDKGVLSRNKPLSIKFPDSEEIPIPKGDFIEIKSILGKWRVNPSMLIQIMKMQGVVEAEYNFYNYEKYEYHNKG